MKVALAQLDCVQEDRNINLNRALHVLEDARKEQCDLVVFPEMFLTGFIYNIVARKLHRFREGMNCESLNNCKLNRLLRLGLQSLGSQSVEAPLL